MAEFIDLTDEGGNQDMQFGETMIRTETRTWQGSEANCANSTSAHDFGQHLPGANASSALRQPPLQDSRYISPYSNSLLRDYTDIVRPIDWSRVNKIRKWEYDPNTIARDVLLATGSHPDRPGLNYHLQPLLRHFTYVNANSDLATFRWDLVDPEGPRIGTRPISTEPIAMPPTAQEHIHTAQNLPVRSPLKPARRGAFSGGYGAGDRPSSNVPVTHRRLHLLDSGFFKRSFNPTPRHDGGAPSEAWGLPRQQVDSRHDMQRIRTSGGLAPSRLWNTSSAPSRGSTGSPVPRAQSPFSVVKEPVTPLTSASQHLLSEISTQALDEGRSESDASSPPSFSIPRRGRPPKARLTIEIPSLNPKKRGRPFKNSEEILGQDLNPKKRGRPFKSVESAAKAAAAASDSADGMPKKRGRPFKVRTQVDISVPEPVFIPFICEWVGCPAELHNLETLEAHIFNVHGKKQPSGTRLCLWGKCRTKHEYVDDDPATARGSPNEFKTKKDWKDHINERHLIPFAWHMGDGPRGTSLSVKSIPELPHWLKDKDHRQVTPSVKDQPIEEGRARDNNARRFVRRIDGTDYVYERIKSPEAYRKVQVLPNDSTSDGDDKDDTRMNEYF